MITNGHEWEEELILSYSCSFVTIRGSSSLSAFIRVHLRFPLFVASVVRGSHDVHRPGGEDDDGGQGDGGLGHGEELGPAGEDGDVGGAEGGAGVEGDEEVVDEAGG